MLIIKKRENLVFESSDLTGNRTKETYEETSCGNEILRLSKSLYEKALGFLPRSYWPEKLNIALESKANITITGENINEEAPMSLITSRQVPNQSEIRMGMHEIEGDLDAYSSILAHELGHMIIEWPSRKQGVVKDSDEVIPFWSKSIYEGVADFFAVILTGSRIIGSENIWFNRSIDDFKDYESAKNSNKGTLSLAVEGLTSQDLDKKYKSYSHWLSLIEKYVNELGEDPYTTGTVLARDLFNLSERIGQDAVMRKIIDIALTGKKFDLPQIFYDEVKSER